MVYDKIDKVKKEHYLFILYVGKEKDLVKPVFLEKDVIENCTYETVIIVNVSNFEVFQNVIWW